MTGRQIRIKRPRAKHFVIADIKKQARTVKRLQKNREKVKAKEGTGNDQ